MNEIKYTPGPWVLDDADNHVDVIAHDYHFIDAGCGYEGGKKPGFGISGCMSEADARLITAAPDLLEALEKLLNSVRSNNEGGWPKTADQIFSEAGSEAIAALAKAHRSLK